MRILSIFQTHAVFGRGNMASEMRVMAQYLQDLGHEVDLLTANYDGVRSFTEPEHQVNVIYLGTVFQAHHMTVNPGLVSFCLRNLRNYDVVHIYGIYDLIGPTVAWFCRRWKIPYVVEPIGMYKPVVRTFLAKRLYHWIFGGHLMKGAVRVVTTSEQERSEVLDGGISPDRIVIRKNGLDMRQFEQLPPRGAFRTELGISEEESLILYVGRISSVKGLDLLVKAFSRLDLPSRLVLVGPDDGDGTVEEIEQLNFAMGLEDRVVLAGPRFGKDKLQALVDSDLFVLPSIHENFGNVVLEAAASGVPVIVSDQCGVASHIEDRAGLVVPRDEDALLTAMRELIVNNELRDRFKASSAQIRDDYSWKEPMLFQQRMYQELVAG